MELKGQPLGQEELTLVEINLLQYKQALQALVPGLREDLALFLSAQVKGFQ